jgi:hypothetical protein
MNDSTTLYTQIFTLLAFHIELHFIDCIWLVLSSLPSKLPFKFITNYNFTQVCQSVSWLVSTLHTSIQEQIPPYKLYIDIHGV